MRKNNTMYVRDPEPKKEPKKVKATKKLTEKTKGDDE